MNIYRLRDRLPRITLGTIDDALTQLRFYRAILGGLHVKMDNHWYRATTLLILGDGSRILRRCDDAGGSFHETFMGIQQLEDRT